MVGKPVDGDPRWTSTITHGISSIAASPRFSIIKLKPGPEVAVIERFPAAEAPMIEAMLANSSSI
jgi:hypothetical protein